MTDSVENTRAKFRSLCAEFPGALKIVGTTGSIFGFIYLFAYTRSAGIPFPLELSVLPSAILLIGIMALLVTTIIFGSVLYPVFLSGESTFITNVVLLAKDVDIDGRWRTGYSRYFAGYWIPMVLTLLGLLLSTKIFDDSALATYGAIACIITAPSLLVFMSRRSYVPLGRRIEYVATAAGQIIVSVFANLMGVLIAVALIPEFGDWDTRAGFFVVLLIFTFIHIPLSMPNYLSEKYQILIPPYFESKTAPKQILTVVILLFFIFMTLVIYPVNAKIGKAVLANFGVGGEIPVSICLKDAPAATVTERISFGVDKCSEPLALLLDAGDRIYVAKPPTDEQKKEKTKIDLPPIYFRQDQVLQKIYLTLPKPEKKQENASKPN